VLADEDQQQRAVEVLAGDGVAAQFAIQLEQKPTPRREVEVDDVAFVNGVQRRDDLGQAFPPLPASTRMQSALR